MVLVSKIGKMGLVHLNILSLSLTHTFIKTLHTEFPSHEITAVSRSGSPEDAHSFAHLPVTCDCSPLELALTSLCTHISGVMLYIPVIALHKMTDK